MDHHHHPSSTTTKKAEDLSHDDKRAKTSASSSTAMYDHGGDAEPLPPPLPPLDLYSLSDIAHEAIASYLTMKDMHCMMESSQWLLKAYGGRIKDLRLASSLDGTQEGDVDPAKSQLALSLISRRPGLSRLALDVDETMGVVAEAMRKGYCDKLQLLEIVDIRQIESEPEHFQALCDALADGLCPKIDALVVPDIDDVVPSVGKALQSRMGKGGRGLKSLVIKTPPGAFFLSPLLSSGACEALEELKLHLMQDKAKEDLSEWLLRTKAPGLRAFDSLSINVAVAQALCSSGVAPRLQVLDLWVAASDCIPPLSQAIGGGAWPNLREFRAAVCNATTQMMLCLVEAIGMGARELTTLHLHGTGVGPEGGVAVARMLRGGGCPRLEELDLTTSFMGDDAVMELARALEGGAPCNTTLRRLVLATCGITSTGMRELLESMGRGALPHLKGLDLCGNSIKDDGVVALAGHMSGGPLRFLQELGLQCVDMGQRGAEALFQALHKPCSHLKELSLEHDVLGDGGVMHLAKAIEEGTLQHLQELYLNHVGMGEEGFKSLVKAIVSQQPNPGCPRLEILYVRDNESVGDDGVVYLADAMKVKGAMQHLREINVVGTGISMKGVKALLKALGKGHACPNLEKLYLPEGLCARSVGQLTSRFMRVRGQQRHCSRITVSSW